MTVASFVAAQRTEHGVPHVICLPGPGRSPSWFYKWRNRGPTRRQQRRVTLDEAVQRSFDASGGRYGSPRVLADWSRTGGGCRRRASRRRWPARVSWHGRRGHGVAG